jgi:AGZA family xanthine/uracil permease-like MFS transporter
MGARAGYSLINGVVIAALCLVGGVTAVLEVVPLEVTLGILLWIGIIMTAQGFQAVPRRHALAVAFGLIPAFAAWGFQMLLEPSLRLGGVSLADAVGPLAQGGVYLKGVIALNQGFLLSSMVLAAMLVFVIDRRFLRAAAWMAAAAVLSAVGLMHGYELTALGVQARFAPAMTDDGLVLVAAPAFAMAYGLGALLLVLIHHFAPAEAVIDVEAMEIG